MCVRARVCVFMGYYWLLELLCSCLIAAHSDVRAFVKNSYDTLCNEDGDLQHLVRSGEEWRGRGGRGGQREGGEDRGREGRKCQQQSLLSSIDSLFLEQGAHPCSG